jgi:hypothetical protein
MIVSAPPWLPSSKAEALQLMNAAFVSAAGKEPGPRHALAIEERHNNQMALPWRITWLDANHVARGRSIVCGLTNNLLQPLHKDWLAVPTWSGEFVGN